MKRKNDSGVVSLEACIVLPIFIFLVLFFYGIMFLFAGEQLVSHSLVQSAVSLSLDSYGADRLKETSEADQLLQNTVNYVLEHGKTAHASSKMWYNDQSKVQDEVKTRFVSYIADGDEKYANKKLKQFGIVGGLDGISFSECKVEGTGREKVLTITIDYEQEFIMDAFGLLSYDRTKTVKQKMW